VVGGGARLLSCRRVAASFSYACVLALGFILFGSRALQNAVAEGDTRTITLHHIHTGEDITVTFKRDGRYDDAALDKLNWFLRDWRRNEQIRMDPHLIDLIWEVHRETGSHQPVWVVCGYRSPQTNAMLRRRSAGVARFSQHMLGHAMDFFIPGVPLEELRVIGMRLQRGGVGFYPSSGSPFVHMDTGGVRHWPRMTREQLVRIFPDGRTVHIPTDGRPLPGYALALADIRKRGDVPSEMSLAAARSAGVNVADAGLAHRVFNPFAKLLGLAREEDEDDGTAAIPAAVAANAPESAGVPLRARAKTAVVAMIDHAEDKLAAEKAKLVRITSRAEEKMAADKAKLLRAAAKAHMIARADAAPLALTPNEIVSARGFWQGVPDGTAAVRPTSMAANPLAALSPLPAAARIGSERDITGSLGASADAGADRVPAEFALAYAEQAGQAPFGDAADAATKAPAAAATGGASAPPGDDEMTIAMKRVSGRPASAIVTVSSRSQALPARGMPLNDPWLRAVVLSPSVNRFLSITALGARDFYGLARLMVKPASAVMMTFAADPNHGLAADHFSGSAVVFVSTVSYPLRTAELQ
jgi:uncharacterized protein YcbK (DUF882 family)